MLIATCLVVAIRTAKWPPRAEGSTSGADLGDEIHFAANLVARALGTLVSKHESLFPQKGEPWYRPTEEDVQQ